jgi:hypothetical protein
LLASDEIDTRLCHGKAGAGVSADYVDVGAGVCVLVLLKSFQHQIFTKPQGQ